MRSGWCMSVEDWFRLVKRLPERRLSDGGQEMHADLSVVSGNGWLKHLLL